MAGMVDFWRSVGLYAYQTHYDCVLGQLLITAGKVEEARLSTACPPTARCWSSLGRGLAQLS